MTSLPANVSPLRQRMIDDMRMRQLAPKTQDVYLHIVRELARFLGRSPDTATVEDLRGYQLYLVDHGTSAVSLNHAITGLKFFFTVTLDRPELIVRMQPVRVPRILPVVLSPDEVRRLAVSRARSTRPVEHATVEPRHSCRRHVPLLHGCDQYGLPARSAQRRGVPWPPNLPEAPRLTRPWQRTHLV